MVYCAFNVEDVFLNKWNMLIGEFKSSKGRGIVGITILFVEEE